MFFSFIGNGEAVQGFNNFRHVFPDMLSPSFARRSRGLRSTWKPLCAPSTSATTPPEVEEEGVGEVVEGEEQPQQ